MIGRNESTTKGESVTGVALTTALYQRRRNEIWCNLMWWWSILEMLPGIETDRIWLSITLITTTRQHPWHRHMACMRVRPSICQCVFVGAQFDDLPQKGLSKGLQIPEDSSPLHNKTEQCWWGWPWRVSSLQQCLPYSQRSSVLVGTAFSDTHTFHPAPQIYGPTHTHSYTHVITHAAL